MSAEIFAGQEVGLPGLAALVLGGLGFVASVIQARVGAARSDVAGRSSAGSIGGILLQMLGFAAVGMGRIRVGLDPAGPAAILEGLLVAALMAGSVVLFLAATRAMGETWSLVARTRADHRLVTDGVFARVRHPIYLGMALFLVALAVAFGHQANLLAGAPLFALGTFIRVRAEERLLRELFADGYDRYAASVKRFVPGLF